MDHIGLANFATIYTQVGEFVQDTEADRLTKIKDRINWNYFDAYQKHDWRDLRRIHEGRHTHLTDADNLTSYASSTLEAFVTNGYEAMPLDVGEIYAITHGNPAGTMETPSVLNKMDQAEFFEATSNNPSQTGSPEVWTLAGTTPLRRPLVVAEQLRFTSTSAADTTTLRLSGISSAAYFGLDTPETVTLNGTTAVNSSTTYARGWSVLWLEINGALMGTLTIAGATSGITYVQVVPTSGLTGGPTFKQRLLVRMWPCPTAGKPYSVLYKRKCAKLINDLDVPLWGISPYLVEKSIADIYEQMRLNELAVVHHQKADGMLARMLQNEESSVLHMSRPAGDGMRMRGGWYRGY